MSEILAFIFGGWLIPAAVHGWAIWRAEGLAEDSPSVFEKIMSSVIGGLMWPLAPIEAEGRDV